MRIVNLEQGTPEWHAWRRTGIGASESANVIGANPYPGGSAVELWEQKVALREAFAGNEHTRRGHRLEPKARDLYTVLTGIRMTPACVIHDEYDWLKASLDGLSDDQSIILEAKAPAKRNHAAVLAGMIPLYWQVQAQHQLLVTGCKVVHFVSYNEDDFEGHERFVLKEIVADEEFQDYLLRQLREFWECVVNRVRPAA